MKAASVVLGLLLISPASLASGPPSRAWGGDGCAPAAELRAIVDAALLVAPAAGAFDDGRGSGAAGYSAAVVHDDCGVLSHAVGQRHVERGRTMEVATRHHVGSLTKPVTTALTLILAEEGLFGSQGLESALADHLSAEESNLLRKGRVEGEPLCPARIVGVNRVSEALRKVKAPCPKFNKVSLRHLLNGNHGLWDFVNEVDRNDNGFLDLSDYLLPELLRELGVEPLVPPQEIGSAFDLLVTTGVLKNKQARIGGTRRQDFETSFGNTGFQLLGYLLESLSGESYNQLARRLIVRPLGLGKLEVLLERPRQLGKKIASPYGVTSGAGADSEELEDDLFGLYPLTDIDGHPAINTFDFEPFLLTNGGGGAGAVVTTPTSYARFFHALVRGGLLRAGAQEVLDGGFLPVQGAGFSHGFGLFEVPSVGLGTLVTKGGLTAGSSCFAVHSRAETGGNGATAVVCRNSADLFLPNEAAGLPPSSLAVDEVATDLLAAARE